jgi:hypothetical protein
MMAIVEHGGAEDHEAASRAALVGVGDRVSGSREAANSGGSGVKLKIALFAAVIFLSSATEIVTPSVRTPERWFYHYDLSYHGRKTWKTLDRPFSTLRECMRFVGQGPWAKGEHCDQSRW